MTVALDRFWRFTSGSTLTFTCTLPEFLTAALTEAGPALRGWLDGSCVVPVSVHNASALHCRLQIDARELNATLELQHRDDDGVTLSVVCCTNATDIVRFERERLTVMLGGDRDAYLALRAAQATHLLMRLRYSPTSDSCALTVFTAPWKERLSPLAAALAPSEITLGILTASSSNPPDAATACA